MKKIDELFKNEIGDLLEEAQEDYIGLWQLSSLAREKFTSGEKSEEASLSLVKSLLQNGLLIGTLSKESHFTAWPDQEAEAVVGRIKREWLGPSPKSDVNASVWFSLPR
jgi:hypothetical protein